MPIEQVVLAPREATTTERNERKRLAATPGLTRAQREALLDETNPLRDARLLHSALRDKLALEAAAQVAEKPEHLDYARKAGLTKTVTVQKGVTNDGRLQHFGGLVTLEVPRVR